MFADLFWVTNQDDCYRQRLKQLWKK